jgi:thiol-disulfide isomerase/thioredoxin
MDIRVLIAGAAIGVSCCAQAGVAEPGTPEAAAEQAQPALPTADDILALEPIAAASEWSPEEIEGRVLAVAVWSSTDRRSFRNISRLESIGRSLGDGMRVVSVHANENTDEAARLAELTAPLCPCLVDAEGGVAGFQVASEPARVMIFDRAGKLRACNPDPRKMASLLRVLVNETPEEAAAAPAWEMPTQAAEAPPPADPDGELAAPDERFPQPGVTRPKAAERPDAAAYQEADWPERSPARSLSAADFQGKKLPNSGHDAGVWFRGAELLTEQPSVSVGERLMVIDFWATWCGPCIRAMPIYDELAAEFGDRVHLIGMAGMNDSKAKVESFIRQNGDHGMVHLFDGRQALSRDMQVRGIPHVAIVSTDGIVRWQGNPLTRNFKDIVRQAVEADPMTPPKPVED